MLVVIDHEFVL